MDIDATLTAADLLPRIATLWELSGAKIESIERDRTAGEASPVFTVAGRYTGRGWTEWTQGFQYGSALLQFDATGDERFLRIGRDHTDRHMAAHVSHMGVHDHGFTVVSTYGTLWRLAGEARIEASDRDVLALRVSGAVQAARWRATADGGGYIYSFNGPQSLFVDTIRSLRALGLAHRLGQVLLGEHDERISLLGRLIDHAHTTARYNVFYGEGRDAYDVPGRTAHESIFNVNDGRFRCPSTQQGYSPFSTWTRGLAWAILGFAEQLEFLADLDDTELEPYGGRAAVTGPILAAARATSDHYLATTPTDGVPYWDTGAPGLASMPEHRHRPADPFNPYEPVDSSAAVIAAQGLLRLGHLLGHDRAAVPSLRSGGSGALRTPSSLLDSAPASLRSSVQTPSAPDLGGAGRSYWQAGLTVSATLLAAPYLGRDDGHQGLVLHCLYHRPNGWDHVAAGQRVPNGESGLWGDYHARELALYLQRVARDQPYLAFFGPRTASRRTVGASP